MKMLGDYDHDRIKLLVTQKVEGDELEEGMKILRNLYAQAKEDKREEVPVSKLRVGLKCGGSDGFSGITANPLVGEFSDWLVAQGGTSILTEVPEMFGAETILMNRCENKELFDKTVHLINDFKEYFLSMVNQLARTLLQVTRQVVSQPSKIRLWVAPRSAAVLR